MIECRGVKLMEASDNIYEVWYSNSEGIDVKRVSANSAEDAFHIAECLVDRSVWKPMQIWKLEYERSYYE